MARLIKEFFSENGRRKSLINLSKEVLSVDFYEDGKYTGSMDFPNKSIRYVEETAENWVVGVMREISNEE